MQFARASYGLLSCQTYLDFAEVGSLSFKLSGTPILNHGLSILINLLQYRAIERLSVGGFVGQRSQSFVKEVCMKRSLLELLHSARERVLTLR